MSVLLQAGPAVDEQPGAGDWDESVGWENLRLAIMQARAETSGGDDSLVTHRLDRSYPAAAAAAAELGENDTVELPALIDELPSDEDVCRKAIDHVTCEQLLGFLRRMREEHPQRAQILALAWGLGDRETVSVSALARRWGVPASRIRRILRQALRELRVSFGVELEEPGEIIELRPAAVCVDELPIAA